MATHVQDPSVIERRLRPIYDLLEVGNNRKALQETEKFLKKNPDILCARALKALALLRVGREDEAQYFIAKIAEENPSDDATLQVMTYCYKEQEQLENICCLYTNAAKQSPGNEDILSHLFMAHVRVNDFASQQSVAMQLFKLKPKNPYYFWAVMSIVLKALRGPDRKDETKSKVMLALAQRMIDKQIKENKLDAEQEVQLYLNILNYQGKYQEALDFMDGELGKRLYPGAPVTLRIDLLKHLQKWSDMNVLLKDLLRDNRERWDYYKEYIRTVVELNKSQTNETEENFFEHCHNFLCELIESDGRVIRGPYLGRLELHKVMTEQQNDAVAMLGDFLELLVEYFRLFGDKPCCANDIILFLDYLEPLRHAELASRLLTVCEITPTTLPRSKEQMQKHICSLQVSRICGAHALSGEHLTALYTAFSLHYEHGMTAFGMGMLPTDLGPSDSYALLAVHVMYDLAVKQQTSEQLVEALCLLHYLLSNSPNNFHAKLLCLQIYHILGCGWGAHQTYESLDIKHVQLDSMGYLHCAQLPMAGIVSITKPLYNATLKFFTTSYKESLEYLAMCYKFGSFSKLQEFMDFRDRLSNSLHYSMVSAEALLLELTTLNGSYAHNMAVINGLNIEPATEPIRWNELTDNRDLSVIVRWDPKYSALDDDGNPIAANTTSTMESDSFTQNLELLRVRSALLRAVSACVEAVSVDDINKRATIATLTVIQTSWTDVLRRTKQLKLNRISNAYLVNLLPSRLHAIHEMPYEEFFTNQIRLVLALEDATEPAHVVAKDFTANISTIGNLLQDTVTEHSKCTDLLWGRRNVQEIIVNCIEILSLGTLVLSVCLEKYTLLSSSKTSKKVKKKSTVNDSSAVVLADKERLRIVAELVTTLKSNLQLCDEALDNWLMPTCPDNITDRIAAMSLNSNVELLVNNMLKDSHTIAVKELKTIVKDKIRMLK